MKTTSTITLATLAAVAALSGLSVHAADTAKPAPAAAASNAGAATAHTSPADQQMIKLATSSGCLTCHGVDASRKGPDGLPPIGPAWIDVAKKYKGDNTALTRLTKTVLAGSNPYQSHWKGKASGLAMPPNAVAISEPDAKKLVQWILGLNG